MRWHDNGRPPLARTKNGLEVWKNLPCHGLQQKDLIATKEMAPRVLE
jgi:hypothetical protein